MCLNVNIDHLFTVVYIEHTYMYAMKTEIAYLLHIFFSTYPISHLPCICKVYFIGSNTSSALHCLKFYLTAFNLTRNVA